MIVDDHHGLAAILASEALAVASSRPAAYLDARIPATMHLRLASALFKPRGGRLTRLLHAAAPDPTNRAALIDVIGTPRPTALTVLDDRPLAAAIAALTSEPGVSIAFGALVAHAQTSGQPVLIDPGNEGRWMDAARERHVEVISRPAQVR